MEVHKHPHDVTRKKGSGEYFLEFIMIFLAVTPGFFAESLRERISDSHREKEFAQQLYGELKDDLLLQQTKSKYASKRKKTWTF